MGFFSLSLCTQAAGSKSDDKEIKTVRNVTIKDTIFSWKIVEKK
jgi:hypothetical protein